jgi:hypothetical protein
MELFKGGLTSLKGARVDEAAKTAMKQERTVGV